MKRLIYPATRAVEHAASLPGVRPIRLFPLLWPLWQVETSAEVHERQDFEVIDHFVMRAIGECDIRERDALVAFLNLPAGLVDRCLAFLATIRQVSRNGPAVELTPLGRQSLSAGVRLVPTTSRLTILLERQSGRPLPAAYYGDRVTVLDTAEIEDGQLADRSRFLQVFTTAPYRPDFVGEIEQDPERADFNLPGRLQNLRVVGVREGYLPSYLVETADHRILAYTGLAEARDEFLEQVCTEMQLEHLIEAKRIRPPREVWQEWLAAPTPYAGGKLVESAEGWHVAMAASAVGDPPRIPPVRIGSYQFRDNLVIRVWCDDRETRRRALLERSLGIATLPDVTSVPELEARTSRLADSLDVATVSVTEMRDHAVKMSDDRRLQRLNHLLGDRRAMPGEPF
ncbi:hypothetical protein ACIA5D_17285 [Actinoplanes sp. NPDC051513]|uniref:hypothetical protein n=1 Tax=Actinoplanes sp. NPDC051513 TaxID=3363908 RepID=UPI003795E01E